MTIADAYAFSSAVFDSAVIDWWSVQDHWGSPGVFVERLLGRLEQRPDARTWKDLERRLVVEGECWCSAGFAALPGLAGIARAAARPDRDRALDLAAVIVRSLHRNHKHDDLVRANRHVPAALYRLAEDRLASVRAPSAASALVHVMQDALGFAGYTFWAKISLNFTDEHYHLGCPSCATRLAIVIGDYGHYAAIRHYNDGDIRRRPLIPADPDQLTGIGRWMYGTAIAGGDTVLANGITYLFGHATCSACECRFPLADSYEAENGPTQPIDPIVPKTDVSLDP
ncbi:hypothetical protein Dvina_16995 [Dactylosporangium vinaceum]|uniref:Uncharacterized protein n=1 Tax=Dactylosporangium vinaceum TaxID=53362 RepID=A0ABV5MKB4_9ACTN|nr:hypothetical protein [Dactylosporangium vinaceum]UAB99614.1 hypothetical protein Dvina_16995 [Dactylosporangium vinaceum]